MRGFARGVVQSAVQPTLCLRAGHESSARAADSIPGFGSNSAKSRMRDDLVKVVEDALDRKVIAFMSTNHIDPDMAVEVFVLEPVDSEE